MDEVLLGPRAYANLIRSADSTWRPTVLRDGRFGAIVDGIRYGVAPATEANEAERQEVIAECAEIFNGAGKALKP